MNKFKTVLWLLIFGLLMLIIFQNQEFFLAKKSLKIDLLFAKYQSPEVPNAVTFLVFFLAGLVISYFFSLAERFKLKMTIKKLNAAMDSQAQAVPPPEKEVNPFPERATDTNQESETREITER